MFLKDIKQLLRKNHFRILGDYKSSVFPLKYYNDSHYHTNSKGMKIRTKNVINLLKENNITAKVKQKKFNFKEYLFKKLDNYKNKFGKLRFKEMKPLEEGDTISCINFPLNPNIIFKNWFKFERGGVWASGNRSIIYFKLKKSKIKKEIHIDLSGDYYTLPNISSVIVNGKVLGEFDLTNTVLPIDKTLVDEKGIVKIELIHTNIKSPYDLNRSSDKRKLKFFLKKISVR